MSHSQTSPSSFVCIDCGGDSPRFPTPEELEIHIASDHLNYCPYECERCRFAKFPTEFALVSHCKNDHGLKEFFVSLTLCAIAILQKDRIEATIFFTSLQIRASLRLRSDEAHLGLGTSNGHGGIYHNEKYEDPDSFPSSVDPSGSSSDHAAGGMQPSSGSSGSTGGVVPPATSPSIPVTPTSITPHVQHNVLNSVNPLQHALGNFGGSLSFITLYSF
ncbi:unnamed protein product [Strongylus vulgaris]|uniref:C2H2-type domain-containing protein n=1 Tax=Strongylus vulgaris TaxID=40348 RepID=A0A3P7IKF5_STRVU|nr:unnamed protein product [Strongylus vulgaris]